MVHVHPESGNSAGSGRCVPENRLPASPCLGVLVRSDQGSSLMDPTMSGSLRVLRVHWLCSAIVLLCPATLSFSACCHLHPSLRASPHPRSLFHNPLFHCALCFLYLPVQIPVSQWSTMAGQLLNQCSSCCTIAVMSTDRSLL